jgi:hypothetical protein
LCNNFESWVLNFVSSKANAKTGKTNAVKGETIEYKLSLKKGK